MKYYKDVLVEGTASTETLSTLLTGTAAEPKHVEALAFIEVTADEQLDAQLRAYKNLERFMDMSYVNFQPAFDVESKAWGEWLDVDLDLAEGDVLKVGMVSSGTESDIRIVARYTVGRR